MIPILIGGASLLVGKAMGKKEADEKLDLVAKLVDLTPDQAQAVEALKKMPVAEAKQRVKLGIGLFKPLPAQASAKAQEVRAGKLAMVTEEEKAMVAASGHSPEVIRALVDKKVSEAAGL